MSKKSKSHFNYVTMFAFGRAILLVSMGTGYLVSDAYTLEKGVQSLILPTPISLDGLYLATKLPFNKALKIMKNRENFRLVPQ
jgi:hypothetical protein